MVSKPGMIAGQELRLYQQPGLAWGPGDPGRPWPRQGPSVLRLGLGASVTAGSHGQV